MAVVRKGIKTSVIVTNALAKKRYRNTKNRRFM